MDKLVHVSLRMVDSKQRKCISIRNSVNQSEIELEVNEMVSYLLIIKF